MSFQVSTPVLLIQCQPYGITWTGGVAPFYLSITRGGDVASVLKNVGEQDGTTYPWMVDEPEGATVTFVVTDSQGHTATSAASPPIMKGATDGCVKDAGKTLASDNTTTSTTPSDTQPSKPSPSNKNSTTILPLPTKSSNSGGDNKNDSDGDSNSNNAHPPVVTITTSDPASPSSGGNNVAAATNSAAVLPVSLSMATMMLGMTVLGALCLV
ncbi:hypothetical protein OC834_002611 [Tilletia horrida]|nr:hypothetical protein OC834_002611 [Tilletia horrida]